jgi:ABC-2 type transport system ATP-binding protein
VIAISGLTKRYGDVLAVDDVSLDVPVGSVCGLLGRNGAGKTTAFKCLLGFARADAGEVRFDGAPLAPETFAKLGYVPERPELYRWLTVAQHLEYARHTQPAYDDARAKELVATFRLNERKKAGKLSKGQQTALALILALVHRPKILILDEPASGLDPVMQRVVLDILVDAATSGATVLISSHQIGQIDRAADRVAIMRDGKIVVAGVIDDLREASRVVEATFAGDVPELTGLDPAMRIERVGTSVRAHANGRTDAVAARFGALGAVGVRVVDRSLEDLFLDAVDDGGNR